MEKIGWIKISEAVVRTGKPARTLRDQVIKGKVRGKKKGKDWYVDPNSLGLKSEDSPSLLEAASGPEQEKKNDIKAAGETSTDQARKGGRKPFGDVKTLGVYAELLTFCRSEAFKKLQNAKVRDSIEKTLVWLCIGYYEFNRRSKMDSYRVARQNILHSLVELHLREADENDEIKETLEQVGKIIPGIAGLIRQIDKGLQHNREKRHEERPGSESSLQD